MPRLDHSSPQPRLGRLAVAGSEGGPLTAAEADNKLQWVDRLNAYCNAPGRFLAVAVADRPVPVVAALALVAHRMLVAASRPLSDPSELAALE